MMDVILVPTSLTKKVTKPVNTSHSQHWDENTEDTNLEEVE